MPSPLQNLHSSPALPQWRIAELEQVTATSNASLSPSANPPAIDQTASTVTAPSYAAAAASAESANTPASSKAPQRSTNTRSPNDARSSKRQPKRDNKIPGKRLDDSSVRRLLLMATDLCTLLAEARILFTNCTVTCPK
ncbi:hypothetical protein [Parasitella parasitica]|uniref:Uncharacterized protein n=1 Tax=Parasitella parasitica TaxID=35722 RepID=A0A0B7N1L6_9FUNG|nr:hypothetical protein [Parasitella parasitica]